MACFLKKHGLIQVRCNKDWGAVVKEKYRALAGAGLDTVADMRCPVAGGMAADYRHRYEEQGPGDYYTEPHPPAQPTGGRIIAPSFLL